MAAEEPHGLDVEVFEPPRAIGEGQPAEPGQLGDQAELHGQSDERSAALARVRAFLLSQGVTEEEVERAQADDVLDLLVADRILVPAQRLYTIDEVSQRTGMPVELVLKFWRALGFHELAPDERALTDLDIEAIVTFQAMVEIGAAEVASAIQLARVIGASMARIAEAETSPTVVGMPGVFVGDSVEEADRFARLAGNSLPAMARLLEFVWRRHLQAATRRAMLLRTRTGTGALPELAVGFADMVGYTILSQHLSEGDLAALVSRFEEVAYDTVVAMGGRVVKMIGDEAMFVTESAIAAARIGLALAEAYAGDELLSDVRVSISMGPVLVQDGDYFGPVVNLASRMVAFARPGSVLVSEQFRQALVAEVTAAGDHRDLADAPRAKDAPHREEADHEADPGNDLGPEFSLRPLRPRMLRDIGLVQLWALCRPGTELSTAHRRRARRWERWFEVLRDIEELRDWGERFLATARATPGTTEESSTARSPTDESAREGSTEENPAEDGSVVEQERGDAERPQLEGAVERLDGSAQ